MSHRQHNCKGNKFRGHNDANLLHHPDRTLAPEHGTRYICVACNNPEPFLNIAQHQGAECPEWNAFNRICNGYQRQFNDGTKPPTVTEAFRLTGEQYRLVRDSLLLGAWIIMNQDEFWGPYTPLQVPHGMMQGNPWWGGQSYEALRQAVMAGLPLTISTPPRPDTRVQAVLKANTNRMFSPTHEIHKQDELRDMQAIQRFMDAHPYLVPIFCALNPLGITNWTTTAIYQSIYPPPHPAANVMNPQPPPPIWCPIAPQGQGPAGRGGHPNGVSGAREQHRNDVFQNVNQGLPFHRVAFSLYQNVDNRYGDTFNIPGTPGRRTP